MIINWEQGGLLREMRESHTFIHCAVALLFVASIALLDCVVDDIKEKSIVRMDATMLERM